MLHGIIGKKVEEQRAAIQSGAMKDPLIERKQQKMAQIQQEQAKRQAVQAEIQRQQAEQERSAGKAAAVGAVSSALGTKPVTQLAADQARKNYESYTGSEEAKQKQRDMLNEAIRMTLGMPTGSVADAPLSAFQGQDAKAEELKARADYAEQQAQTAQDAAVMEADLKELESWPEEDKAALEKYIIQRNQESYDFTRAPSFDNARYDARALLQKYGAKKVQEMAESYARNQNAQNAEKAAQAGREGAGSGILGAIGHSAASVGANVVGNVTGMLGRIGEIGQGTGRYQTLDPNNVGSLPQVYAGAVREQVASDIEGDGGMLGKVGATVYQAGMSAADSLARAVLGGGNKAISLGLAASGSYSQTVSEASKQGATPGQAVLLGVANAGLETATEYIPLDNLLKAGKSGVKSAGQAFMEALKQAGMEATTEEISFLGSLAAEAAILREKSSYNQQIGDLVANGMSYADAVEQANKACWEEAKQTFFVSALSGGMTSGVQTTVNKGVELMMDAVEKVARRNGVNPYAKEEAAPKTKQQMDLDAAIKETLGMEPAQMEQKNTASEGTVVNVRSGNTALTEENKAKNTLAYALASNIDKVQDMEPVSQLTGSEFNNRSMKVSDQIRAFFKSIGNMVSRNGFGDVELGEYGVGGVLNHRPINRAKIVSLAAVPDVIQNGRQINYEPNWKGRGYESFTFAAPVTVAGKDVYVAAIVNKLPNNKFYLSEMVDSEGNYVRIEESPSGNSKNGLPMGPEHQQGRDYAGPEGLSEGSNPTANAEPMPLPNNIISDNGGDVNGNSGRRVDPEESVGAAPAGFGENTVGSAQSGFEHKVRRSKVYDNTYANATGKGTRAVGDEAQKQDRNIAYYDSVTEKESVYNAMQRVGKKGSDPNAVYEVSREEVDVEYEYLIGKDGWTSEDNDTAMIVLNALRKEGDLLRLKQLAKTQRAQGTTGAQLVQSFAKYSRTPTKAAADAVITLDDMAKSDISRRYYRGKNFDSWKEGINKSILDIANEIDNVPEGDAEGMQNIVRQLANFRRTTAWAGISSKLTKAADRIVGKLDYETAKEIAASQLSMIPNDFRKRSVGETVKTIRIHNMLSALTTVNRNLGGNATTGMMDAFSDSTGGRMADMLMAKATGKRTVGNDARYIKEYLTAAKNAADMAALCVELDIPMETEAAYSSGKTRNYSPNSGLVTRFLSAYEKYLKYSLEVTDKFFEGGTSGAVNKSLRSLGKKSGLSQPEIELLSQKVGERRTFKEGRRLSQANTKLKEALNYIGTKNLGAGDLLIPFAGVPGDVTQVGVDYSGGGLIEGFTEISSVIKDAKAGKEIDVYRQRKAATDFGRGMTGVGLIATFTALAAAGVVGVHDDRDKDKRTLEQSMGLSGAQFNIDAAIRAMNGESTEWLETDLVVSVDFLEPFNSQMYIGYLMAQEENIQDMVKSYPRNAFRGISQSVLDMPMMQTFSDTADIISSLTEISEDGNFDAVWDAVGQLGGNVMTGFIPSWMRQAAYYIDPYYRDTSGKNAMEKAANQVKAAVPFLSQTLPKKIDGLGNEQLRYEDKTEGFVDTFISPTDTTRIKDSEIMDYLDVLSDKTGDYTIYPESSAPKSFKVNGEDVVVSGQQREIYQQTYGRNITALYGELMKSEGFAELPDELQVEALKKAKEYATQLAKASVSDYDDVPVGRVEKLAMDIVNNQVTNTFSDAFTELTKTWSDEATESLGDAYALYKEMPAETQGSIRQQANGRLEAFLAASDAGINVAQFASAYEAYYTIDQDQKLDETGKATQWALTLQKEVERGNLTQQQADTLKDSLKYWRQLPAEAGNKFDQLTESGISADDAQDLGWLLNGIEPQEGYTTVRAVQKAEAIAESSLSEADKIAALRIYGNDAQDENLDQMLSMGFSAADYVAAYRLYSDASGDGKKRRTIAQYQEKFGVDYATAKVIYEIYG